MKWQEKERLQLRVGIFLFIGFVLLVAIIFTLGDQRNIFSSQFSLYCDFDDISGLRHGAPVQLAGVNIGQVDQISFSDDPTVTEVRVRLNINRSYKERIRTDSKASIQGQGLLGDKLIFISVGSPVKPVIKEGALLESSSQAGLAAFMEKGGEVMDSVQNILKQVESGKGLLHSLLYEEKGERVGSDLAEISQSLKEVFSEVRDGDGFLHGLIYDKENGETMGNISFASENLKQMAKNFREISDRINAGEGSIGGLINDPTVYYDLKTLMGKANRHKLLKTVIRSILKKQDEDLIGKTTAP